MEYKNNHKNLITEELNFWKNWFKNEGGIYKDDYKFRIDNNSKINESCWILKDLNPNDKVLDVGCGPIPSYGYYLGKSKINLTGVDPLANEYNELIEKYIPSLNFRGTFGYGEKLQELFQQNEFDRVVSRNALDHSYNPITCLKNMINVCKTSGIIKFIVYENEAIHANYTGLHQWNFFIENERLKLSNKFQETFIEDHIECESIKPILSKDRLIFVEIKPSHEA